MNRPTRKLLLGISIVWVPLAFLSDGLTVLLLPIRLGNVADPSTIGLITFVALGIGVAVQPLAGLTSDRLRGRFDRRLFLVAASGPVLAGLALFGASRSVAAAIAGYLAITLSASAVQAAQQSLIPERVAPRDRGRAAGLKTTFDVGGSFLAFLLLGALLAERHIGPATVLVAVILLAALGVMWWLVPSSQGAATEGRAATISLPAGFVSLVVARFLFLFGVFGVGRFLLLLVAERMGLGLTPAADEAGGLLALFTLVTVVAALPAGALSDRMSSRVVMNAGAASAAIGILIFVPSLGLIGMVVGGVLMSLGTGVFMSANWAVTTRLVPAEAAGRLMGLANIGTGLAAACAGLLGPLISLAGFTPALTLAAMSVAATAIPLRLTVQRAPSMEQPA